jgi:ABC-2 type transport system permease protein
VRKVLVIARREYRANVRSKAFVISLVLMPLLMAGGGLMQSGLRGRVDLEEKRIAVADGTGRLLPLLQAALEARNRSEVLDPEDGKQVEARFRLEEVAGPLTDQRRLELSERIRKRRLHAFAEVAPEVLSAPPGARPGAGAGFHSESAISSGLFRWFARALDDAIHTERLRAAGIDPKVVATATAPVRLEVGGLYQRNERGQITSGDRRSRDAAFILPVAVMLLMFLALMMSQTMLQSTLEEKQQRIAEVLLGSARPFELMLGKLLGGAAVSLTTVALYLAGGSWLMGHLGYGALLRQELLAAVVVFQILGVIIYGSVFAAVGAACNDLKEAQSFLLPIMMVLILPLMIWFKILEEPTSGFATAMSFVPLWSPMLMPLRLAATQAIPLWQPVVAGLGSLLTAIAAAWAGGRVFRVGLLLQGKAPRLGQLIRWVVRG